MQILVVQKNKTTNVKFFLEPKAALAELERVAPKCDSAWCGDVDDLLEAHEQPIRIVDLARGVVWK